MKCLSFSCTKNEVISSSALILFWVSYQGYNESVIKYIRSKSFYVSTCISFMYYSLVSIYSLLGPLWYLGKSTSLNFNHPYLLDLCVYLTFSYPSFLKFERLCPFIDFIVVIVDLRTAHCSFIFCFSPTLILLTLANTVDMHQTWVYHSSLNFESDDMNVKGLVY
jgi:hypothetical protein